MADKFIIVIEADNLRAHAAYLKGLADLELIWPQLMEYAQKEDAKQKSIREKLREQQQRESEEYSAALQKYYSDIANWNNSSSFIFGGLKPRPIMPMPRCASMFALSDLPISKRLVYENIRSELRRMANLAGAALGPFRMTENQVQEMIGWEDGSKIESMKFGILDENYD